LFVFSKLIAHGMSLLVLVRHGLETGFLDHFSTATLGRAVVDASIMTMYISEPSLSTDSWNLRRHVLFLHDLTNRKRFLAALGEEFPFFENYDQIKSDLKRAIADFGVRLGLSGEEITKLQDGQVFVSGVRGAIREAGWLQDSFEFHQAYFSAYVHSHPVSFMRADEHAISFVEPSPFQLAFCAIVLEACSGYISAVTERMASFSKVDGGDPLGHIE